MFATASGSWTDQLLREERLDKQSWLSQVGCSLSSRSLPACLAIWWYERIGHDRNMLVVQDTTKPALLGLSPDQKCVAQVAGCQLKVQLHLVGSDMLVYVSTAFAEHITSDSLSINPAYHQSSPWA